MGAAKWPFICSSRACALFTPCPGWNTRQLCVACARSVLHYCVTVISCGRLRALYWEGKHAIEIPWSEATSATYMLQFFMWRPRRTSTNEYARDDFKVTMKYQWITKCGRLVESDDTFTRRQLSIALTTHSSTTQMLALFSPTRGCRTARKFACGIKATEFLLFPLFGGVVHEGAPFCSSVLIFSQTKAVKGQF